MNAYSFRKLSARTVAVVLVGLLALFGIFYAINRAQAGTGLGVTPDFPTTVTVGDTGVAASLTVANTSTADEGAVTISNVTLIPQCGNFTSSCTAPDPGVFSLSATGTGRTGTSCASDTFNISQIDATTGQVSFVRQGGSLVLAFGASCTIDFTVNVMKVPTIDALGDPGIQTAQRGSADGLSALGHPADGTGSDSTTVNKISPSISTTLVPAGPVAIGASVHDSASLTGASSNAGGTVTYHAYAGANTCTGTDLLNSTKTVTSGVVPDSNSISFASAGTYSFQAVYSGDASNNGATSVCSTEQLVVNPNTPSISTTLVPAGPVAIGASVHDSATLTGATATAGGTVTYHAYAGSNTCSGTDLLNSTKTVTSGSVPDSGSLSFASAGTYSFQATYSGDANNTGPVSSACTSEQLVVSPNQPSISTTLVPAGPVAIGASVHDSAVLTGATANAGGTVTYHAYAGANTCTGTDLLNSTKTVTSGNVPDSNSISFLTAGTYSFQATYSGDANNTGPVSSACSSEQLVVSPNQPSISTSLSASTVNINTNVHDSSTLTGATATAGGTVTYHAYSGANTCTGTDLLDSQVTVTNGSVPDSGNVSFPTAGTYSFQAVYSGDANNSGATSTCSTEQLVVNNFTASMTTAIHTGTTDSGSPSVVTSVPAGSTVHDSATITFSGPVPTGNVLFTFFTGASNCDSQFISAGSVPINGSGVADPSSAQGPLAAGSYAFRAHWAGDSNYPAGATSACEPLTVTQRQPSVATTLSASTVDVNTALHDSATLTGATATAGGTVTYNVYSGSLCSGSPVFTSTVTVTNGVVPNSGNFTPTTAGTYNWQAVYSGDANNLTATSGCGTETLVVNQPAVQGCSPGYWKQPQHFGSYPTTATPPVYPNTLFVTVFGVDAFPGKTLLDVLSTGGGGLNALGRIMVGAYLNAATINNFAYTTTQVKADFVAAYNSHNYGPTQSKYEALQDPCPLGNNPGSAGPVAGTSATTADKPGNGKNK